eukprot:753388-Hanusia_phi.AAC.8
MEASPHCITRYLFLLFLLSLLFAWFSLPSPHLHTRILRYSSTHPLVAADHDLCFPGARHAATRCAVPLLLSLPDSHRAVGAAAARDVDGSHPGNAYPRPCADHDGSSVADAVYLERVSDPQEPVRASSSTSSALFSLLSRTATENYELDSITSKNRNSKKKV